MKNFNLRLLFFFSFFLLFATHILAQDAFRTKMNTVFQNVNKTLVPTQYLKEYGYPFLALDRFNGSLQDTNLLDMGAWRMLYGTFGTSYVGSNSPPIPACLSLSF